jgi:hypothetical protein
MLTERLTKTRRSVFFTAGVAKRPSPDRLELRPRFKMAGAAPLSPHSIGDGTIRRRATAQSPRPLIKKK